jgi:DNA-binding NarL/FixJ family response regulator
MLRILLADDHDVVRRGLKELLEERPGWTVCAEAANGRQAVELALEHRPHVAVIDLTMPELNGLEATRRIREAVPETEVLVFTMHDSEELVRNVLAAGARGYLLKSDAARQLVPALESLAQHKPFFAGRISEVLLAGFLESGRQKPHLWATVSRRANEVAHSGEGNSNKAIAQRSI